MQAGALGRKVSPISGVALVPGMPHREAARVLAEVNAGTTAFNLMQSLEHSRLRARHVRGFGFGIITHEELDVLCCLMRDAHVLDAGSGSGYLSRLLADRGVSAFACDNQAWGTYGGGWSEPYKRDSSQSAVDLTEEGFGCVLMSWPPIHDPFAFEVAKKMVAGQVLIYLGEGPGGCTGSASFFDHVADDSRWEHLDVQTDELNRWHLRFDGIKDRWMVLRVRQ